ncbi:MAG: ABC transporter ATP-binding protein [Candidatus Woesearchaeota archaeon]|nr:ABC transporter ATP-binding protein [Candidatus Woesearchaeota archaeon]
MKDNNNRLPLVSLNDVWKIYRMGEVDVPALRGATVDIYKGEFVAIIGQSGSGKSTMMNMVGCLDMPSRGTVMLKSHDISKLSESDLSTLRGKAVGFIFQQYNLIQNMTAFENVMLPLEFLEIDEHEAQAKARKVLESVGLHDKMYHLPSQLSGGQQQRVSIARSLVTDPEIILADEPTGALDSVTGREVLSTLQTLWKKEGKTIIMVTHDLNLARYAQKHVELKDGKVVDIRENNNIIYSDKR